MEKSKQSTIVLNVRDKPGTLIRIALVFSRRGYNIESLVVSTSQQKGFSIMTIVTTGDVSGLQNILKQLNKLVDVVSAHDRTDHDVVTRELSLIKLRYTQETRLHILSIANAFRCTVLDLDKECIIIEAHGSTDTIERLKNALEEFDVIEEISTGNVLISRSAEPTS